MASNFDETMFRNQSSITENVNVKNTYRVLILGAANTGKSSLVNWLLGHTFRDNYVPTIEDFHVKMFKIRGDIYRIELLDTSGNDPFPAMKKLNIMIGDLFILLFSLDDLNSYIRMKQLSKQIIETKQQSKSNLSNRKAHKYIPILILGNKLDLLTSKRIPKKCVEACEVEKFVSSLKYSLYHETSCKDSVGLQFAFQTFLHQWSLPMEICPGKHVEMDSNLDLMKQPFHNTRDEHKQSRAYKYTQEPSTCQEEDFVYKRRDSFKQAARKSLRRIAFRRQSEPCGAIMLNVRRPSIQTEMRLLEQKTNKFNGDSCKQSSDKLKFCNRQCSIL